jgi:hypothetical protein
MLQLLIVYILATVVNCCSCECWQLLLQLWMFLNMMQLEMFFQPYAVVNLLPNWSCECDLELWMLQLIIAYHYDTVVNHYDTVVNCYSCECFGSCECFLICCCCECSVTMQQLWMFTKNLQLWMWFEVLNECFSIILLLWMFYRHSVDVNNL